MTIPLPLNEVERMHSLSNLDIDYSELENEFSCMLKIVSKITDMDVILLSMVDSHTQWTIAQHGIQITSLPREECICQYTISGTEVFEISNLSKDNRFKNISYVKNEPYLNYYLGIPLEISKGVNIGTLSIMDRHATEINPEKIELLKLIGEEIVNKLKTFNVINGLKTNLSDAIKMQRKIAHDIRNPLAGIIGISDLLIDENEVHEKIEVVEYVTLINSSSKSILEITDNIVTELGDNDSEPYSFNLKTLSDRLSQLFMPLAKNKEVTLDFFINSNKQHIPFSKSKILQIAGSPVSSAIKLSRAGAKISIDLDLGIQSDSNILNIVVKSDTPISVDVNPESVVLNFTKQFVENMNGKFDFSCDEQNGLAYVISLPQTT
ncbi:His Kinase A (phospho-acceptor) domain-containing protein [Daejeonella rubra]|uniref:histidine kinase n=1 Tax=Daejeonella rubra TaxID=990371 RepID=A0A1G9UXY0_9SPHI|nr:histidine kinase dimerization/phospho-acceptor domain-containing protein [Daejeonella rubra]SDM64811.1 His Kinase A (phospho-acceptor) domain-containing protein [Daejeonella rubra]